METQTVIANRQTAKGHLRVTLGMIDSAGAYVNATLDDAQIARTARVVEMPVMFQAKVPAAFSHLFYTTDGSQTPVPLRADEMVPVLAQVQAYQEEMHRQAQQPGRRERARIRSLFETAKRHQDDSGRYFPALHRAQEALTSWQAQYPDAARAERYWILIAEAEALEHKADGALLYDADGWLSAEEQEQRAAAFRAQAQTTRDEAARLA